jgi:trimethylamine--corrinoid protein Co-methyltransferase
MMKQPPVTQPPVKTSGIRPLVNQRLEVLSADDIDKIHAATLRILERVGVRFDSQEALSLLRKAGAEIDGSQVRFPARMVEKAIESAPARVTLYARDPAKNMYLGEGSIHFTSGFGATWVRDSDTGRIRAATREDLAIFTRLADALDLVHMVLFAVVPQDVPARLLDVICTAEVLQNTSKHVQLSLEAAELVDYVLNIARQMVGKGEPLPVSAGGVPNSPLHYSEDVAVKFIRLARENVPCFIVCGAMAGATAPVTLAGLLAQQNAEFLAGLVIHQRANPGAPAVYGTFSGGFDMRYTKLALGGPEVSLITCATQQLSDRYGIPLGYATGGVTDSPVSDIQTGVEKTFGVLAAALAGVDVIHDGVSGLLGAGMVTSLGQQLVDQDMCASIRFFLQGIPVSSYTLAEDLIISTGAGGNFMLSDHTVAEMRKSLFIAPMRGRNLDPLNTPEPSSYLLANATKQAKKLLAAHQTLPVTDEQRLAIAKINDEARLYINRQIGE